MMACITTCMYYGFIDKTPRSAEAMELYAEIPVPFTILKLVSIFIVMCLASIFILPLTVLLIVQTQNFLSNKTTQARLKAKQVAGIPIKEMQGRELAESMMINYSENRHIFSDSSDGGAQDQQISEEDDESGPRLRKSKTLWKEDGIDYQPYKTKPRINCCTFSFPRRLT